MKINDELAIDEVAVEMYNIAADHGFHNPGGGGLDDDATWLLSLVEVITDHWEKLRKGIPAFPLTGERIIEQATRKDEECCKLSSIFTRSTDPSTFPAPIRSDGELVDARRMARFLINLIGEASELWKAVRLDELTSTCDKEGCSLTSEEEEMADLAIRLMDMAVARRVDLGKAISIKSKYNKTRPFMHGKKA